MRTITLPAHDRPFYLRETINSLSELDLTGYKLFVNLEPGCQENIDIIESIDFIDVDLKVNDEKLGVRGNPFDLLDRTFEAGSTWNYHIEDDLIFSPDCMNLVRWYEENQRDDVILYGTCYRDNRTTDPDDNIIVYRNDGFSGLGWCITDKTWREHIRKQWFTKSPYGPMRDEGWDFSLSRYIQQTGLKEMTPLLPRSTTIGEYGTFSTPVTHAGFNNLIISGSDQVDFKYVEVSNA